MSDRRCIGHVRLPVYELGERQIAGLRQAMVSAGPHGVSSGAGLGSDAVWVELKEGGRTCFRYVTGRDLLCAVAELAGHPDADRFPTTENFNVNARTEVHHETDA